MQKRLSPRRPRALYLPRSHETPLYRAAEMRRLAPRSLVFHRIGLTLDPLLSCLFDTRCVACGRRQSRTLCASCRTCLAPSHVPCCPRCDLPRQESAAPCPDCRRLGAPAFEALVAAAPYEGGVRALVRSLKYEGRWRAAEPLGEAVAARVARAGIEVDVVVPVPIDEARRQARGYSPSELLASRVGVRLGVPVRPRLLCRRVQGVVQSTADRARRLAQMAEVFTAADGVEGKRVLLVDDVATTAATLHAAAAALHRSGAQAWGAVAARQTLHGGRT